MMVGAQDNDGTLANPWEGDLQDVGVWNAYLTDEEIAALAAGQWCNRIRPASLQLWVPVFHRDYICDQSQNRYAETQTTAGGYGGQPGPPMAKLTRDRLVGDPYVAQAAAVDPSMLPMDYELIRPGRGTVKSLAF